MPLFLSIRFRICQGLRRLLTSRGSSLYGAWRRGQHHMSRVIAHGQTNTVHMWRVLLLCCVSGALSSPLSFIDPCVIDDDACILKSANAAMPAFLKGIPELDIAPMEPLFISKISNNDAGLKLTFTDSLTKGLSTCAITNIKSQLLTKHTQSLTIKCADLLIEGRYSIEGQLIIFPIQGAGNFKIGLRDAVIKVHTNLTTETGADGKPHLKVTDWRHSFKVLSGATFDFENLFNGNKAIAAPILQYMNENWKDVLQEAGPPIHTAIVKTIVDDANKMYKYAPKDYLYKI